jgi:hypothetical protein
MCFQRNISLLFWNGGSSALGVHWCRAIRSSGEGHDRFGGEDRDESTCSRRSQRARGVVEREEDGLLRSGTVEMPPGGAEAWWRARSLRRHGGARSWSRGDLSQRCVKVSFFRTVRGEWISI